MWAPELTLNQLLRLPSICSSGPFLLDYLDFCSLPQFYDLEFLHFSLVFHAGSARCADDARRHAGHCRVVRHRAKHHGARRHARAMAHLDIAEHLGARRQQNAVPDFWMPVADFLAGAAERYALENRDVVADLGRLADDELILLHGRGTRPCRTWRRD